MVSSGGLPSPPSTSNEHTPQHFFRSGLDRSPARHNMLWEHLTCVLFINRVCGYPWNPPNAGDYCYEGTTSYVTPCGNECQYRGSDRH